MDALHTTLHALAGTNERASGPFSPKLDCSVDVLHKKTSRTTAVVPYIGSNGGHKTPLFSKKTTTTDFCTTQRLHVVSDTHRSIHLYTYSYSDWPYIHTIYNMHPPHAQWRTTGIKPSSTCTTAVSIRAYTHPQLTRSKRNICIYIPIYAVRVCSTILKEEAWGTWSGSVEAVSMLSPQRACVARKLQKVYFVVSPTNLIDCQHKKNHVRIYANTEHRPRDGLFSFQAT